MPNATATLILGIISIATCWCYSLPGLICSIIALILAGKDNSLYNANPESYTLSSYNNLKAGKICAIIGLALSILYGIAVAFLLVMYGTKLGDPDFLKELQKMK